MGDGFNWWLLLLGVAGGALLTWLVLADSTRRDREIADDELVAEAGWIARNTGSPVVDSAVAEEVLRAHRRYLGFPPPDVLVAPDELPGLETQGMSAEPPSDLVADVAEGGDAAAADEGAGPAA